MIYLIGRATSCNEFVKTRMLDSREVKRLVKKDFRRKFTSKDTVYLLNGCADYMDAINHVYLMVPDDQIKREHI